MDENNESDHLKIKFEQTIRHIEQAHSAFATFFKAKSEVDLYPRI